MFEKLIMEIRTRLKLPACDGIRVRTTKGELGIITGIEGGLFKIYFDDSKRIDCYHPQLV